MSDSGLRIIFAGTPDFAAHHLQVLLNSEHQVIAAYTQPDRPAGRGKKLVSSPVKQLAEQHQVPVYQPQNFKDEVDQQQLKDLNADIMVVVAYGLLLPQVVLDTPRLGCINVHASLLPRWRGAAPIQRAVAAGDNASGVTIMQMDIGLDTGDMLVKTHCPIAPDETGGSLHDKLQAQGGPALLQALSQLASGTSQPQVQDDSQANYAHKLSKQEAAIDWQQPARQIEQMVRAFNPFPVAYFVDGKDRIRVWQTKPLAASSSSQPGTIIAASNDGIEVATGEGSLLIETLQLPGKKALPVANILNGYKERFAPGKVFG
ncbi:MAG: methionyl-tRNA formyltransferase [Candidatus Pelagadaptatus aseana]|uniref:methionyl-tRNA formyltransferase n=1 Tax=Candidatus Pelagadaptatus aseana TaxID=3120508 RepID=UPI0039B2A451